MLRIYAMKLDSKGYNLKLKIKERNRVRHAPEGLDPFVFRIPAGICTKSRWRIRDEGERITLWGAAVWRSVRRLEHDSH